MPDPPDLNRRFPLPFAPQNDPEDEASATVEFLPPLVSRALIAGWILLFAGRWLVVQGMAAAGLFGQEQVDQLDENVLGRCYLLLLSVTLVTFIVRIVRGLSSERDPFGANTAGNAREGAVSAVEGAVEAESSDRGGKQA
jgi:hypothetical protein